LHFLLSSLDTKGEVTLKEMNAYLKKRKEPKFEDFKAYVNYIKEFCVVNFDENDWMKSTCTCRDFQKSYICSHTIAVAINNRKHKPSDAAKTDADGDDFVPRRPGRPKKAKGALLID